MSTKCLHISSHVFPQNCVIIQMNISNEGENISMWNSKGLKNKTLMIYLKNQYYNKHLNVPSFAEWCCSGQRVHGPFKEHLSQHCSIPLPAEPVIM